MRVFASILLVFLSFCYGGKGDKAPSKIVAGAVSSIPTHTPGEVQRKVGIIESIIRNNKNKDSKTVQTANDRLKQQAAKDETARKESEAAAKKKSIEDSKNKISSNVKKETDNAKSKIKNSSLSPSSSSSSVFTKFDKDGKR